MSNGNDPYAALNKKETLRRQPRLKPLYTKEDVDAVPHFDEEDKQAALGKLLRSVKNYNNQPTITVGVGVHDPKGAAAVGRYSDVLRPLVTPTPRDGHTVGGTILNLLVMSVHKHTKDECLLGGLARFAAERHVPGFKVHHYALMEFPESEVWNPEQRLMLRYAKAVLEGTMTDELWSDAVKTWGVKMCLRYIQFIGYFWYAGVRNRTLQVPYPMLTEAEGHVTPLDSLKEKW
jgi:hypothetical protein